MNNLNRNWQYQGSFHRDPNAKLPEARGFVPVPGLQYCLLSELHVPNQDVGYVPATSGFISGSDLFKCSDGTILDLRRHTIVKQADLNQIKDVSPEHVQAEWHDSDVMCDYCKMMDLKNIANDDVNVALMRAREEMKNAYDQMTDDLKKLIADFESVHPSKWVNESRHA